MTQPTISAFSVITEDVEQNASSMSATAEEIASELGSLRSFVAGTEDFWKGADHTAFMNLMSGFDQNAASLNDALRQISGGLRGNAQNYGAAGTQNASMLSNVHDSLPPARF